MEWLLDRAFRVPGTDIRFGLDAIIGLMPGIGDGASSLISGLFVLAAIHAGVEKRVIGQMLANILIDLVVGSIPVVGDLFDVAHKANTKNLALLRAALKR